MEIIPGNVILCTSLKRHPYQTTSILIKHRAKKVIRRIKKMALQRNIFKRKTFWNFFSLTIQAIFFLLQRSSESVVLKHEVTLLPLCCPQPCPAPLLVLRTQNSQYRYWWRAGLTNHTARVKIRPPPSISSYDLQADYLTSLSLPFLTRKMEKTALISEAVVRI